LFAALRGLFLPVLLDLFEANKVAVAYGAAEVLFAFFAAVPLRFAGPVDLARFTTINFIMGIRHLLPLSFIRYSICAVLSIYFSLFAAAQAYALTQKEAMTQIFTGASSFKARKAASIDYFEAQKGGEFQGYCINVTARGYGGPICMVVGIDGDGIIKGIKILDHCETPGIGSRINETTRGEKGPWFLEQFAGRSGRTVALNRDIDAVSGATISSSAVTTAVNAAVNRFLDAMSAVKRK
jgi:electron transport complex protein RnfG